MNMRRSVMGAFIAAALAVVMVVFVMDTDNAASGATRTVSVGCEQDLAKVVNADPKTTATRFSLSSCGYTASSTVKPQAGDEIAGPEGTFTQRGPAFQPNTKATVTGTGGLDQVIKPQGTVRLAWFAVTGGHFNGSPGSGSGIAGGATSPQGTIYAVRAYGNDGLGISNANGTLERVELDRNGTASGAAGFIASGVKGVNEFAVENSYIHDNGGSGVWCDEFCDDTSAASNGRFWVHGNLVVDNGRAGVRFEKVGTDASSGEALIEANEIHGNGYESAKGGVSIRDAANAIVKANVFGGNAKALAVIASDSGRKDRPDLKNILIQDNSLNGESIKGCELPDTVVLCAGN